ncbi:uracil-DNA glycosylase [Ilumatobacter nonamiensis]|uniref:uracil-DNA glycosylase n=1 Tax=Ilumatobacter nonamiensis TaxID=467093 RepID=UPI00034ACCD9|nr:uracil-DNA glycosylase [Ilumatobacter nonamiensis]
MATTDWNPLLRAEFDQPYWTELQDFVAGERRHHTVYPPHEDVFAALHLTSYADLKVVIVGQDPYHGPRQAHGLAFSVRSGVQVPPSLRNIHKELHDDLGLPIPDHGNLEPWARSGVLLLNTSLTVRAGQAGSHSGHGWETFTDRVTDVAAAHEEPVVFILWGNHARRKRERVDTSRHGIIESTHPSPFSASNGFFGSKPFSRANEELIRLGREPVDWSLVGSDPTEPGMH